MAAEPTAEMLDGSITSALENPLLSFFAALLVILSYSFNCILPITILKNREFGNFSKMGIFLKWVLVYRYI